MTAKAFLVGLALSALDSRGVAYDGRRSWFAGLTITGTGLQEVLRLTSGSGPATPVLDVLRSTPAQKLWWE
jgi:hypothetical protein